MNSDTRRMQNPYPHEPEVHGPYNLYQPYYSYAGLWDRLGNLAVVVPAVVLALTVVYQFGVQQGALAPLSTFLWDLLVSAIPARVLYAIDRLLNPPLFPRHMLPTQSRAHDAYDHVAKSHVLQRLLGIDKHRTIIQSVSQAGRSTFSVPFGVALRTITMAPNQPPGLPNATGKECFHNSILQGLSIFKAYTAYLSSVSTKQHKAGNATPIADTLRSILVDLANPVNNGKVFKVKEPLRLLPTTDEQDAHEYYLSLCLVVKEELLKPAPVSLALTDYKQYNSPNDDSAGTQHGSGSGCSSQPAGSGARPEPDLGRNPLQGFEMHRTTCLKCKYCPAYRSVPYFSITLLLSPGRKVTSLEASLNAYTALGIVEKVDCSKCTILEAYSALKKPDSRSADNTHPSIEKIREAIENEDYDDETVEKCGILKQVKSSKTQQVSFSRFPNVLVFHINRSMMEGTKARKLRGKFEYPPKFDFGPWQVGSAGQLAEEVEEWPTDPTASMAARDQQASKIKGQIYQLRAVVAHGGEDHSSGHYVCYRQHPESGWTQQTTKGRPQADAPGTDTESFWRLSDLNGYQVSEKKVLEPDEDVFMLFYELSPEIVERSRDVSSPLSHDRTPPIPTGPHVFNLDLVEALCKEESSHPTRAMVELPGATSETENNDPSKISLSESDVESAAKQLVDTSSAEQLKAVGDPGQAIEQSNEENPTPVKEEVTAVANGGQEQQEDKKSKKQQKKQRQAQRKKEEKKQEENEKKRREEERKRLEENMKRDEEAKTREEEEMNPLEKEIKRLEEDKRMMEKKAKLVEERDKMVKEEMEVISKNMREEGLDPDSELGRQEVASRWVKQHKEKNNPVNPVEELEKLHREEEEILEKINRLENRLEEEKSMLAHCEKSEKDAQDTFREYREKTQSKDTDSKEVGGERREEQEKMERKVLERIEKQMDLEIAEATRRVNALRKGQEERRLEREKLDIEKNGRAEVKIRGLARRTLANVEEHGAPPNEIEGIAGRIEAKMKAQGVLPKDRSETLTIARGSAALLDAAATPEDASDSSETLTGEPVAPAGSDLMGFGF
ncbi:hypothetical protein B0H66DRAFT_530510 [Apodospora peruviana]|uniref:ubiquitinyl hydrolase 1 n=1 Tax=Apodospora peruviana TaxID=516989 RepID=A0AAE0MBI9_9PEZI|nr:hypothetical protein B0H66DRAFT_530510 [Apodospora peruviana]